MEIHNLMEDAVARRVNELCDDHESRNQGRYCTTDQCRLDAICYVLNRIQPHYVTSSRGVAHLSGDLDNNQQLQIDITRLAQEGLARVSAIRRSYYNEPEGASALQGPCFNFPTIKGRILNGKSFVPESGFEVTLLIGEAVAPMYDSRWQNPYEVVGNAPGTFIFWPAPIAAERAGVSREFSCELRVEDDRFEEFRHFFTIRLESDDSSAETFTYNSDYNLRDLYIFPAKSVG